MDDCELLELAAKAAGLRVVDTSGQGLRISSDGCCTGYPWNPLTDDGDALRLAVKLTLELDVCRSGIAVRSPRGIKTLVSAEDEPDAYIATRRAIVRAAAELGKVLP